MRIHAVAASIMAFCIAVPAAAQSFFLPANDLRLRDDLSLLVDEGVVNLPVNEWPLAREDVATAIAMVEPTDLHDLALQRALARVQKATTLPEDASNWRIREVSLTAGSAGLLRDYATLGRDHLEVTSTGGSVNDRYGIKLAATGVIDPDDGQNLRLDGSEITVRWGNWLFSANQMDRWWGPGRDGSLILSTNARPMPAISLDRYRSLPVDLPVLRWLGPWRFSGYLGMMENDRPDVDRPAFMGMRLSFKPAPIFEFGMSRTAQFCGKGRRCDLKTFGRMLIGDDNRGLRGLPDDPNAEPGNQMAGFDVRVVSPFKALPVAIYGQEIGEDNSSTGIPERYLALFGGETWFFLDSGSVLRAHIEYANTKIKWYDSEIEYDSAYQQGIFFAGYRYRGRNIGHTTDADSESKSFGLSLTRADGDRWAILFLQGRLDRCCGVDSYHSTSAGQSDFTSTRVSWEGEFRDLEFGVQVGYQEQQSASLGKKDGAFGFVQVRKALR